ncbi:MAG: hypothetical protein O2887_03495 [Bacteroidetes bacterium]|nr:hypothetical protein [Bacteroidota bacterium]MDA1119550.1 hypothetical protein [Bacteroidota bacterium]
MALHHLSINLSDNLNIGLFEATVFSNEDSVGGRFELNYLNPIIFYRGIEQMVGSPDNALIGMDFKWNPGTHLSFYGQFLLDEMVVSDLFNGSGWWGNKIAGQLGLKYIDVIGISNLDLQIESNFARPYTYSHESSFTNFSHYGQPLAHPLGANFSEIIFLARYQPIPRLSINGKLIMANQGKDPAGLNYGSNVLLSYNTRENDYDNTLGQGVDTKIRLLDITASYQLRHNFFIDLKQIVRKMDSENNSLDQTTMYTALSLRLNIAQRLLDF